jgi:hypothetical protein
MDMSTGMPAPDTAAVAALRSAMEGHVIAPGDLSYEEARQTWRPRGIGGPC